MEALDIAPGLTADIDRLIALKATKSEAYFHEGEQAVKDFIAECIETADQEAKSLSPAKADPETLNHFFRKTLEEKWTSKT